MMGACRAVFLIGVLGAVAVVAFPETRVERQADDVPSQQPIDSGIEGDIEGEAGLDEPEDPLGLPANASSLLPNGGPAADTFSCAGRGYGYFADPDNGCKVFHVCVPVHLPQSEPGAPPTDTRFSFVCPANTVFNQESFTCTRPEDAIPCEESPQYYHLNEAIGQTEDHTTAPDSTAEEAVDGNQL